MLQETCRNIGNDVTVKPRPKGSPVRPSLSTTLPAPRHTKERMKKSSARYEGLSGGAGQPPTACIHSTATTIPSQASVSTSQSDYTSQCTTASQYDILYQRLLYQAELDKLQTTQAMNINPFISPPCSSFLPTYPASLSPPATAAPVTNPHSNTDFAKLAAFFYQKLQQSSTPINPATEALHNYRKLFLDNSNSFLPSPTQELAGSGAHMKIHECQWVTAEGYCGKKHYSHEDLMLHLRSHVSTPVDRSPRFSLGHMSATSTSTPSLLNVPPEYHSRLSKDLTKSLSRNSIKFQPYSIPSRQISVPFLL